MAKKRTKTDLVTPSSKGNNEQELPGYAELLSEIKVQIRSAQLNAVRAVNRRLTVLYWEIGKSIVKRQQAEGWGKAVVDRLSSDLQTEFPDSRGFSSRNIWRMRSFYLAYRERLTNLPQAVADLPGTELSSPERDAIAPELPQAVAEIPWGHNSVIIEKLKDPTQRLWYAVKTVEHGWARAVLIHQIESDAYARQGQAITSFETALPKPQSDLAQQIIKDPYNFDFLGLSAEVSERELEKGLIDHLRTFLIELGKGFAFVGQQYHLEVAEQDYYLDLLFYHVPLGCYFVIDLKVEDFKPEYAGKMNFYLTAVDESLPNPTERPAIGLILCRQRNKTIVEYTLRDATKPIGVATYSMVPPNLANELPTAEELQSVLSRADSQRPS
ncbi:MAG: PDDEXK nuclease domain-containing protein [Planctomycetota bacterium]